MIEAFPHGVRQQSSGIIVKSGRLSAEVGRRFCRAVMGSANSFAWRLRRRTGGVSIPGAAVYEPGGQKDDAGKLVFLSDAVEF